MVAGLTYPYPYTPTPTPTPTQVESFPRKAAPPERPGTDEDCPGFAEFAEQRDLTGLVEAATATLLQVALSFHAV